MKAILDGRTTPITIDYFYTFTNFEWARGHVKFNRGFDIPTNGTIDIFCPTTFFGDCLISGKTESTWSMSLMRIASFATAVVDVGITLEAETFEIVNHGAITLDNAVLDIRSTVTDDMPIAGINGGAGTFIFSGKSTLKSSTGNHLFAYPSYDFLFLSGSRLSLGEGTKFTIF